ncbi:C-terminal binding protein [Streptomycetaceae bacterium NBC_01309]
MGAARRAVVGIVDSVHNRYVDAPHIESEVLGELADVEHVLVESTDGLGARLARYDALISWHTVPLDREALAALDRCVGIVRAAVGFDNIDIGFAAERGIPVANVPDYGTEEVADHTLALVLALTRRLFPANRQAQEGNWDWRVVGPVRRLRGMRLGVVGMGRIGTAVARRAQAFGFDCAFHDPYQPVGLEKALGVRRHHDLDALAAESDVISLHVPLTHETHHLVSKRLLDRVKPGVVLVNTSRGAVVDGAALNEALADGRVGAAGLDVLEGEPDVDPALRAAPHVVMTAHSAFYAVESLAELRRSAALAAARYLRGEPEPRTVNGVASGAKTVADRFGG